MKRIYRSTTDRKIAGVCAGLAEYLDTDPTIVRIVMAVLTACWGTGILVYILAAIIIPEKPRENNDNYNNNANYYNNGYGNSDNPNNNQM